MKKILLTAAVLAAVTGWALPKAVCFRFDDNQTVEKYTVMAETFRKNNARFSMSLIPFASQSRTPEWRKMVRRLEKEGFEILDHTPQHSTLTVSFPAGDPLLKKAQNAPFVHHITNGRVCLKYNMKNSLWSKPFEVEIKEGNKISFVPAFKTRKLIRIKDQYFYVVPKKLTLLSIWAENNVRLPDGKVQAQISLSGLDPYPGAAEFLIETSREGFRRIGLKKMPVVWIQPGGYYPHLKNASMSKILKKYGYISASTQPGRIKGFGAPQMENNCFSLDWGDFNLENQSLAAVKTRIADAAACHRPAVGTSHIRTRELKKYAEQHGELLKWLNQNGIRVLTQGELASLLLKTSIDRKANVFPSLTCDLDKNGRPDGYFAARGVRFSKDMISLAGKGKVLWINWLCGLPRGKVRLSFEHKTAGKGKAVIRFIKAGRKPCGTWQMPLSPSKTWKKESRQLTIPADCAAINFEIYKSDTARGELRHLELKGL